MRERYLLVTFQKLLGASVFSQTAINTNKFITKTEQHIILKLKHFILHKQMVWRWSSFGIWGSVLYIYNRCCCRETGTAVSCTSGCIKGNTFILRWWCEIYNGLTRIFSNWFLYFPPFKMMSQGVLNLWEKKNLERIFIQLYLISSHQVGQIKQREKKLQRKEYNTFNNTESSKGFLELRWKSFFQYLCL